MILTRDIINILAPTHGRTSCSDSNLSNGGYKLKEEKLQGIIISRHYEWAPRCSRCFLLDHEGCDTDLMEIEVIPEIRLVPRQPNVKITVEELK